MTWAPPRDYQLLQPRDLPPTPCHVLFLLCDLVAEDTGFCPVDFPRVPSSQHVPVVELNTFLCPLFLELGFQLVEGQIVACFSGQDPFGGGRLHPPPPHLARRVHPGLVVAQPRVVGAQMRNLVSAAHCNPHAPWFLHRWAGWLYKAARPSPLRGLYRDLHRKAA